MRYALIAFTLLLAALLLAPSARAQETGQAGLELGTNAIGVIWHLNDRIAIRPEGTFSFSTGEITEATGWGLGVSVLFYLNHVDKLSTYFVPRFLYQRTTTSSSVSALGDLTSNAYDVSGSFGAQYALHRRFSVFGEVGLLIRDTNTNALSTFLSGTSTTTVRPQTGFGAILYFK